MKLLHVLERVTQNPWVITPAGYAAVRQLIDSKLAGSDLRVQQADDDDLDGDAGGGVQSTLDGGAKVAQITVSGTLGQRLSWLENFCGGCDYLDITAAIDKVLAEGADGILFVFDSPGGMAIGCSECAQVILDVPVPTVAFTDSIMCSGAYWLASGCEHIVATKSADVGSIGVIIPWVDQSKLWDQVGMKYDPITSKGDSLKALGGGPNLTDEEREYLQDRVNQTAADFRKAATTFRDLDFAELKAGSYFGKQALDFNLIDQIGSLADAQNQLMKRISAGVAD